MSENFTIEIIRPDKSILNSEATEVTIPSYEGEMGILKDHIPLITFLRPGLIIVKNNSDENFFFTEDGIVEFANNNLLILSSTTKNLNSLEKNFIDTMIKNSQNKFNSDETNDKEKYLLSYKIETLKQINQ
ncbi:ATP synthase F1 subunit epsilon [Pelagibacteraceae bacterium]|nr:ATP synthase F1 subunit epsilon [Pelagibacteraceae bacterium]